MIAVIGTINWDRIQPFQGEPFESLGGIVYNVVALSYLAQGERICPVAWVGQDRQDLVMELFGRLGVDGAGISVHPGITNRVALRYITPGDREEILRSGSPELTWGMIEPFLDADLILLNFTWGEELDLRTVKRLQQEYQGTLYIDVHSLTLGTAADGRRFLRQVPRWREWVRGASIVQANLDEIACLTSIRPADPEEYRRALAIIMDAEVGSVLVTRGPEGVMVATTDSSGLVLHDIPAPPSDLGDATGCGDVFAAGCIAAYMQGKPLVEAAGYGVRCGSLCCTGRGIGSLEVLADRAH